MSLDKNLFTLHITPNKDDPDVIDLVDPNGTVHYRKQRVVGTSYKADVYDPMSESLLISAIAPSATSKHKTLELYNPTLTLELKHTGTLSFRWSFKWEEHEFEWKREECFMLRKPDPPVLVAVTKEPPGRIKTSVVQILDYNLNRFDIEDRKGLEIVILTALLTFQDWSDVHHGSREEVTNPGSSATIVRRTSEGAPPPPPKPAPKKGIERIAEMQALRREINEVAVEDEGSVNDYGQYCANLLQDEAMLFITVRSSAATHVPKVLQVVEEAKRIRYKTGLADNQELHQYVLYDTGPTASAQKGPRRINLNDDANGDKSKVDSKYAPPTSLTVHLSKIPMPELQPRSHVIPVANAKPPGPDKRGDKHRKEGKKEKEKLARETEEKKPRKDDNKKAQSSKFSKPPKNSSPPRPRASSHTHAHQVHPNQPSPSPAQLNNPEIYAAPPPRPPHDPYTHPRPQPGPPPSNRPGAGHKPRRPQSSGNLNALNARPPNSSSGTSPSDSKPTTPAPIASASTVVAGLLDKFSQWQHRHE